jgi:hypothetical protein
MIRNEARTGNHITQREVLNFVETEFQQTVAYRWLDGFLSRRVDEVRRVDVAPHDFPRRQILRSYLDRYLAFIKSWVSLVSAELVFNLDETGLRDLNFTISPTQQPLKRKTILTIMINQNPENYDVGPSANSLRI